MEIIPAKKLDVVKLKYEEDEAGLTYPVLRRQVEFWLESLQAAAPVPMDLSTLMPTAVSKLSEEQLEGALCVLREKGGGGGKGKKGKKGKKGRKGKNKGKEKGKIVAARKIAGNRWNCDKPSHTSQDCQQSRHVGLQSLSDDEDDDDETQALMRTAPV